MFKKSLLILIPILLLTVVVSAQPLVWNTASSYPIPVRDATVIYYNGYVYSIGGRTSGETSTTHAIDNVYYAAVNPDGSIDAWTATTALPGKRAAGGAYAYNGRLYFWGGWMEDYTTMNTCYYAPINPDGSIGTWVTSSVTIPNSSGGNSQMDSFGRGVLGFNDTLYILAGEDNLGTIQSSCYYSKIQGSGDYGSWTATTDLPINVWFHGAMIYTGASATYIYQLGGLVGGQANIYYNTINPDGTLGATWQLATNALTIALYDPGCAFALDSIFVIGGLNGYTSLDRVQRCRINPSTGDIDEVVEETVLPAARARTSAVGYTADGEEYILVVGGGGYATTDTVYADCWYSLVPRPTKSYPWSLYE
jgi:hypothetical protein